MVTWAKRQEPFTNPNSSLLGQKANQRAKNYKWYVGPRSANYGCLDKTGVYTLEVYCLSWATDL